MSLSLPTVSAANDLSISFGALNIIGRTRSLPYARKESDARYNDRVERNSHRGLEFKLGRKRHSILGVVHNVEVGRYTWEALLLLYLHLFRCDLLVRCVNNDRGHVFQLEPDVSQQNT